MLRGLIHRWRINLAVLLAVVVATTVLAGALLVGDSVRGSLRDLILDRLGRIDAAVVTERFFSADLVERIAADPRFDGHFTAVAPAVLATGSAVAPDAGTRASRVWIHGIDGRFGAMFGDAAAPDFARAPGQLFPSVVINESLRAELQVEVGDALLLSFGRVSRVPRDTLMGDTQLQELIGALRVSVSAVIEDRGMGRFGLAPNQHRPLNAFLSLATLQRALDRAGSVNAIFFARAAATAGEGSGDAILADAVTLDDLGLRVRPATDHLIVDSREFVLRPVVEEAVDRVLAQAALPAVRVQSYLVNDLRAGDRRLPYSLVAAVDAVTGPPWSTLTLADGSPARLPGPGGILLNAWAAEDLGADPETELAAEYYVVGPRERLRVERTTSRVEGVVRIAGMGADRTLTPEYPGIQEARDIAAWDPPFPVDLDRIRPKDEDYWDRFGATPKAFVSAETGRKLWGNRYGHTTSILVGLAEGDTPPAAADRLAAALERELSPPAFGFRLREVKRSGLAAAAGATDFSMLFVSFSFFLIVSSALLVALLFGLGVEQRAGEIGLLLALGFRLRAVRRRLLAEGALLAGIGASLGLLGGLGYAWLLMAALRTIWLPAVGSSQLFLHVVPLRLALGWVAALAVVLLSIALTLRRLRRVPPPTLLAGSLRREEHRARRRWAIWIGLVGLAVGLGWIGYAAVTGSMSAVVLAFGAGSLLLVAGLALFSAWCRGLRRGSAGRPAGGVAGMALRNTAWSPGRSVLCVALVASACFVIVALAANREPPGESFDRPDSGSGGFALIAEADVPLHGDLNRQPARFDLGIGSADDALLAPLAFYPFRSRPGDDASCLNLYLPGRPRLLGTPPELVRRGGFRFAQHVELDPGMTGPWELLDRELEPGVVPAIADVNSAMWILHLGLGRDLVTEDEQGRPLRLRLVGLLQSSILQSELLLSERDFLEHFPSQTGYGYFLIDTKGGDVEAITRVLERDLAPFGFDITGSRERSEAYQAVEHTYLATFQLLGALGLLLGTVGLAIVLVRNVIERRGELATLRAFGFRRASLARMVLAENAVLLLFGMLIGSLSALLAVAPRLAHIEAPWGALAATLGAVLAVGMLASVAALSGALRTPLLPALKRE